MRWVTRADKLELAEALVTRLRNRELTPTLFEYDLRRLRLDRDDHAQFMAISFDCRAVHGGVSAAPYVGQRYPVSDAAKAARDRAWLSAYFAVRR